MSPSGSAFTKAIVIRLLSGGTPIPVASWTSKTKTLTGLTAAADGSSGNDWTINLAAFTTDTVAVGYVNVTCLCGVTYALSISVVRVFNPVLVIKGAWVSGTQYTGNCIQRDAVKYTDGELVYGTDKRRNDIYHLGGAEWEGKLKQV